MKCNMLVAELQFKFDQAKSRTVAGDYAWTDLSNVLANRALMIGRIIMYVTTSSTFLVVEFDLSCIIYTFVIQIRQVNWRQNYLSVVESYRKTLRDDSGARLQ